MPLVCSTYKYIHPVCLCATQGLRRSDLQVRDAIGRDKGVSGASRTEPTQFWAYFNPSPTFRCALCVHAGDWTSTWGASNLTSKPPKSLAHRYKGQKMTDFLNGFFLRAHCQLSILRLVLVWRSVQLVEKVIQTEKKRRSSHLFFVHSMTNTSVWRRTSVTSWTGEWPLTLIYKKKQLYMSDSISHCLLTQLSEF